MVKVKKEDITSYLDACKHLGIDPNDDIPYKNPKTSKHFYLNACAMIDTIRCCINGDWIPDWNDSSEYKYYPYFDLRSTGASHGSGRATTKTDPSSGFAFDGTGNANTYSCVGSRLCFQTKEDAEYCGKTFLHIYRDMYCFNPRIDNINNILK